LLPQRSGIDQIPFWAGKGGGEGPVILEREVTQRNAGRRHYDTRSGALGGTGNETAGAIKMVCFC
jgi:hypothetical protein